MCFIWSEGHPAVGIKIGMYNQYNGNRGNVLSTLAEKGFLLIFFPVWEYKGNIKGTKYDTKKYEYTYSKYA